jgi:hypothetical protein
LSDERKVTIENGEAVIDGPPEEMKAFAAGLRIGYKRGFAAGYAQRVSDEAPIVDPSEILHTKLN